MTAVSDPAVPRAPSSMPTRSLFVSDVHLDPAAPEAQRQFLEFLQTHVGSTARTHALYILGDLFESWVGDDDLSSDRAEVLAALRALTTGGIACFLLHGNRDFLIGQDFCLQTGCQLLPDPVIAEIA